MKYLQARVQIQTPRWTISEGAPILQCGIVQQLPQVRNLKSLISYFFFTFLFYMRLRISQFFILGDYLCTCSQRQWGRDSVVGYGLDGPEFETHWGQDRFASPYSTKPDLRPTHFLHKGNRCSFMGVRRSENFDEHPPPFAPSLRISRGIDLLPPLCLQGML